MENGIIQYGSGGYPMALKGLAEMGRGFLFNAAQNLIQFGRVICEAKPQVPHGKFGEWVTAEFGISQSTAEQYMAVYRRFGENEQYSGVKFSVLREMLSLPEGTEEAFSRENDLNDMTSRAVKEAVKKARDEMQQQIDAEREAREIAERRVKVMEETPSEIPQEIVDTINAQKAEIERRDNEIRNIQGAAQQALNDMNSMRRELAEKNRDLREAEDALAESQQEYDRVNTELLNIRSAEARGDAERVISDKLSSEDFAAAVRDFIGVCAQLPLMGTDFAVMDADEKAAFDRSLKTIEDFADRARSAMDTAFGLVVEL